MVMIDWLLQAGFRIRGEQAAVAVDPYLSDACASIYGLVRSADSPVAASDLAVDALCVSHWHEDHLDMPTVLTALRSGTRVIGPPSCIARIEGATTQAVDIDRSLLAPIRLGQTVKVGGGSVTAVPARHAVPGYLTEDAVGYAIQMDGRRIYHTGDTEYDRSLLAAGSEPIDVLLTCINGTGGNMNAIEAATLTAQLRPSVAVPMHFGLWAPEGYGPGATLDASAFGELLAALAPDVVVAAPSTETPLEVSMRRGGPMLDSV